MKIKLISGLGTVWLFAAGGAALASGSPPPAPAQGRPTVTVGNMHVFPNGPDVVGASILTRYNTFVDGKLSTTGLEPNGAYTWWWIIFNHPEYCVDGCGPDDLPPNGDPRVLASSLWGGGFVANGTGAAEVEARLERGKAPGEVRVGPGLRRPRKAEIHIALRTHGPAIAGEVADQIGSFDGGCTEEEIAAKTCPNANVQSAAHLVAATP